MKNFVLVHGSWYGAWCWERVAEGLRAAGHRVQDLVRRYVACWVTPSTAKHRQTTKALERAARGPSLANRMRTPVALFSLLFSLLVASCAAAPSTAPAKDTAASAAAGRMGVHGMVVFGDKRTFMSHIPMFRAPHDAQVVLEVDLPDAHPSFTDGLYTFEPERFDLDALVSGQKTAITGAFYRGSFEDGGHLLQKMVTVKVVRVVVSRVPIAGEPPPAVPTYWLVGSREDAYLVHVIGKAPGFDQIVRAKVTGADIVDDALLARGKTVTLENRTDDLAGRALPGTTLRAAGGRSTIDVQPIAELSCFIGPDFDKPCK